ncbi:MAG: cytochrome b [Gallionella sp.]
MIVRYTRTAITLHWLIALLIFATFPIGFYMHDLKLSPMKLHLYSYHKWIGITILILAILRILWRATHHPPALNLARWQQLASKTIHYLFYSLIVLIPFSGWLMSSAKGVQTVWLGVLPLPNLVAKDKLLGNLLSNVHEVLNYTLLLLITLHIAAALKHHFIDRDEVLSRMLPIQNKP